MLMKKVSLSVQLKNAQTILAGWQKQSSEQAAYIKQLRVKLDLHERYLKVLEVQLGIVK